MKAAVIGSPVSHSLSPAIFAFISQDQERVLEYQAIEVNSDDHKKLFQEIIKSKDFVGCNITLPLKELFVSHCDKLSDAAKAIGAMNVLQLEDGLVHGHNTDVIGIEKTFLKNDYSVKGKVCLLWGAGGSAKAVAFVLGKLKADTVYIYNRGDRGVELADHFSTHYPDTNFNFINNLDLIKDVSIDLMINSTPLGMQGHESGEDYFSKCKNLKFSKTALAFDLIYVPEHTDFLKAASHCGLATVGGLGMLIDQALATWEIWFGPIVNEDQLHQRLKMFLKGILNLRFKSSPVYLAGFMGVGKSTVGKRLAELTNREFIDTDKIIETNNNLTIAQIFSTKGEAEFRKLETTAIEQVSKKSHSIVSLGGGSLNQELNRKFILSTGILVYLDADVKTLGLRINSQGLNRPILEGLKGEEQIAQITNLLKERSSYYGKAHVKVNTVGISATQVSFDIISKIGELA